MLAGKRTVSVAAFVGGCAFLLATAAHAESRLGGETDDSVCDVGATYKRHNTWPVAADFVRARCKNGQLLMGSSIVPAGGFDSEIKRLTRGFCRIADIQLQRTAGELLGIPTEFEEGRCKIEKLPQ